MPDDLGDLSLLLAPSPGEPGPRPVEHHLAAGRAVLRRRRLVAVGATLVTLGVVGVGATTVGGALTAGPAVQDPAGPARPSVVPSPDAGPDTAPAPTRTPGIRVPGDATPGGGRATGPAVIGGVRVATGSEVAELDRADGQRVMLADDGAVVVAPGWEVLERLDDPAPLEVLNRRVNPDTIVDAVTLAVARTDRPAGAAPRDYYLLDADSTGLGSATWSPVTPLAGSLSWWTVQQMYADTPMNNGTPGTDVELLGDGTLQALDGAQVLEELRDPDTGRYLPEEQTLTVAARVRVVDGRELFAIATRGPAYSATTWFSPTEPVADLDEFLTLLRDLHGERP